MGAGLSNTAKASGHTHRTLRVSRHPLTLQMYSVVDILTRPSSRRRGGVPLSQVRPPPALTEEDPEFAPEGGLGTTSTVTANGEDLPPLARLPWHGGCRP